MDINWLEDFVCLARTLNFTRAAAARNITQSAFSRRIKSLEIWVGASLIERSTYPVRLTQSGEDFLPVARDIVSTLIRNRDQLQAQDRGSMKFQSFAAMHTVSVTHLAPFITALRSKIPALRTRVMSDNLHACCQRISDGDCDFLFCYRHPNIPLSLDERRFEELAIGKEQLLPVVVPDENGTPRWLLPGQGPDKIPHLAYAGGSFLRAVVDSILLGKTTQLETCHIDAFAEALKSMTVVGMGISWLSATSIREALERGTLVAAGNEEWQTSLTLSVFAAPEQLDLQGQLIWNYLKTWSMARQTADKNQHVCGKTEDETLPAMP